MSCLKEILEKSCIFQKEWLTTLNRMFLDSLKFPWKPYLPTCLAQTAFAQIKAIQFAVRYGRFSLTEYLFNLHCLISCSSAVLLTWLLLVLIPSWHTLPYLFKMTDKHIIIIQSATSVGIITQISFVVQSSY